MPRIIALFFIFLATSFAWLILSATVSHRTDAQDTKLRHAVGQIWGGRIVQQAPTPRYVTTEYATEKTTKDGVETVTVTERSATHAGTIESSDVRVDLELEHRRKGLLWYPTYRSSFSGTYTVTQPDKNRLKRYVFAMKLPSADAVFENFSVLVDGEPSDSFVMSNGQVELLLPAHPGKTQTIRVSYDAQGLEQWWYSFGESVENVRNFNLVMRCDFKDIDFPDSGISPTVKTETDDGWELVWDYSNLLTAVQIGLEMPRKLNPGPWVEQVTKAAPVSLFLFFFLLFIITTLRGVDIHPMNYFFIAAAFFSFHLLLAYTADHLSIHAAFLLSAAVSIGLVVSYMRLVAGLRFALVEVGVTQFVYLVLFSYTFFFQGFTGLAITVLCIVTLFIVMQLTGRVDWEQALKPRGGSPNDPGTSDPDSDPHEDTTPCQDATATLLARTRPRHGDDELLSLD